MEEKHYVVVRIEGEYAVLQNIDGGGEVPVALALLPPDVDLGTALRYQCFCYEVE